MKDQAVITKLDDAISSEDNTDEGRATMALRKVNSGHFNKADRLGCITAEVV